MDGGRVSEGVDGPTHPATLEAFASRSTLHGISHILGSGPAGLRRLLWAASFLASVSLLALVCLERVAYYLEYPHVTKLDEVSAANLTFPAVTICNLNEFRFSKITQNDLFHVGELLALLDRRHEISRPALAEARALAVLQRLANFRHFRPGPFSMADFYNRTGHALRDMLLMCTFRGSNCTHRNFSTVADRVDYYTQYHHVTTLDELDSSNMVFPAVTLCNENILRKSRLDQNDVYWLSSLLGVQRSDFSAFLQAIGQNPDLTRFLPTRTYDMTELFDRAGHDISDMLLDCKYRGEECTMEDFTTIFTRYGKCYTFNSGKEGYPLLTTVKGGTGNGLEVMLDIQQDEYLPVWDKTEETSFEAGLKIQIHTQDEPPYIHELGFGVAPGFQTFVSTQEQRILYLPPPWGDCRATTLNSGFFSTYSITACRIDCETRYLVENCNCRMVHMPGNADVCTPEQYKNCADPALEFLVEQDSKYCLCETPCNVTRFAKEISMVKIPSKASAKFLAKKFNKTEQYIAENILVLDIFFEALNYETIEQKKAYEMAGLLGDIGGQMGLFIGASILTILEIIDYLYEVLKDKMLSYVKDRKRPKRSHSDNLSTCDTLRSHSDSLGFTPNVLPRHHTLGNFEEFAC